jgi:hypothetical protein
MPDAATTYPIADAGIDWITATSFPHGAGRQFLEVGEELLEEVAAEGNDIKTSAQFGYDVRHAGQVAVGIRPADVMVRLSGATAARAWWMVAELARRVSRLDMQVTVRVEPPRPHYVLDCWDHLETAPPEGHRPRSRSLIVSRPAGATLYVGSRRSDAMLRIYDKGIEQESEVAGKLWRYEMEYKRSVSLGMVQKLRTLGAWSTTCSAQVHSDTVRRQIRPLWSATETAPVRPDRPVTDDDSRIEYLRTTIAPMLDKLAAAGRGPEAARALGYPEIAAVERSFRAEDAGDYYQPAQN